MMCDQLIDEAAEALIPEDRIWEKITVNVEEFRVMGDPAFRMHFRLSEDVFENLLQDIGNHLIEEQRLKRERRPLSHILLMVLWILATPECFRAVALRYEACPSEVHDAYVYIIEALRELAPRFITWPNQEERVVIKANMRRISDFPGIVGIIDGCNVPISAPVEDKAAYRDYHHQYSIKMQAVCDDKLLLRDLYVGEAGSLHDARVFRRSPLCSNLLEDPNILSEGEHIIGDSAYMLLNQVY
ncbi:hypothetical protein FOCC_FOCC000812 [Frankliniella occidentalis]|nr:hypothetical protein FOCC_FOCC000812 [Frankliniella occidentalis]